MRACAVVPQKPLGSAKSRLAGALSPHAREALSLALLRTVCTVLRATCGVEEVLVMTPDPQVRTFAATCGVRSVLDPVPGLNQALVEVFRGLQGGSHALLVVAADLPLVQPADVAALMAAGTRETLVLAPARDGAGTNALLVPPATPFHPAYGPASLHAHRTLARTLGLGVVEVRRPGLAFDVDTPADLAGLHCAQTFNSLSVPVTM